MVDVYVIQALVMECYQDGSQNMQNKLTNFNYKSLNQSQIGNGGGWPIIWLRWPIIYVQISPKMS